MGPETASPEQAAAAVQQERRTDPAAPSLASTESVAGGEVEREVVATGEDADMSQLSATVGELIDGAVVGSAGEDGNGSNVPPEVYEARALDRRRFKSAHARLLKKLQDGNRIKKLEGEASEKAAADKRLRLKEKVLALSSASADSGGRPLPPPGAGDDAGVAASRDTLAAAATPADAKLPGAGPPAGSGANAVRASRTSGLRASGSKAAAADGGSDGKPGGPQTDDDDSGSSTATSAPRAVTNAANGFLERLRQSQEKRNKGADIAFYDWGRWRKKHNVDEDTKVFR